MRHGEILLGDCRESLRSLPAESVNLCVTSPPYFGLRDYGMDAQMGLEATPDAFVAELVDVFREVRRVLTDDGTLWLNIGDSYAGSWGAQGRSGAMADRSVVQARSIAAHPTRMSGTGSTKHLTGIKPKDLIGIPWMLAFALRADGWYLREDIIWRKPNCMPDSTKDRCTRSHEYIFHLSKSRRYYHDADAIAEPAVSKHSSGNGFKRDARVSYQNADGSARGNDDQWTGVGGTRNKRSVWDVSTQPFKGAHFATFPPALIEPCILAGSPVGGVVLDPFFGAGTTGMVAEKHGRRWIGCELNPEYAAIARARIEPPLVPTAAMYAAIAV